jgi:hypothetical protein
MGCSANFLAPVQGVQAMQASVEIIWLCVRRNFFGNTQHFHARKQGCLGCTACTVLIS